MFGDNRHIRFLILTSELLAGELLAFWLICSKAIIIAGS
jgi:hypothetical protein